MNFCSNCGDKIDSNKNFCTNCGQALVGNSKLIKGANYIADVSSDMTNTQHEVYSIKTQPSLRSPAVVISSICLLLLVITLGLFSKPIISNYYLAKYNSSKNIDDKLNYAYKAFLKANNNKTKLAFETTLNHFVENDAINAEEKLSQYKNSLSSEDFNQISIALYNAKAEKLAKDSMFKEAFKELVKIQALKGDFKSNKSYEKIMLGLVSDTLTIPNYDSRSLLEKERNIYIRNMDEDAFDEIIELKKISINSYSAGFIVDLYKLKNNEYVKVDSVSVDSLENVTQLGVYPYEKDKYGIFISGGMAKYNKITFVYEISNSSISELSSASGYNYCEAIDVDNDGFYEIESHQVANTNDFGRYSNADIPLIKQIYKVNSSGKNLVLFKSEKLQLSSSTFNNNVFTLSDGYIFTDSNSRYLTDNELSSLTREQLELARNEIFARYGYIFTTQKFKTYFESKSWYIPNPNYKGEEEILNDFEKANCKIIKKWEDVK